MHSIAASAAMRAGCPADRLDRIVRASCDGANTPFACCHFSKKRLMSVARSLMTGRLRSGPISSVPPSTTLATCVRQVQRGRPLTVIAQEPHMPTRQAKR